MESAEEGKSTLNLQLHRQSLTTVRAYVMEAGIAVFLIPSVPAVICNSYCFYTQTCKSCQRRAWTHQAAQADRRGPPSRRSPGKVDGFKTESLCTTEAEGSNCTG